MSKPSPGESGCPTGTSGVLSEIWGHKGLLEKSLEPAKLQVTLKAYPDDWVSAPEACGMLRSVPLKEETPAPSPLQGAQDKQVSVPAACVPVPSPVPTSTLPAI